MCDYFLHRCPNCSEMFRTEVFSGPGEHIKYHIFTAPEEVIQELKGSFPVFVCTECWTSYQIYTGVTGIHSIQKIKR